MASLNSHCGDTRPPAAAAGLLAVERSTALGSVAVYRGGVRCSSVRGGAGAGREVCALVDEALAAAGMAPAECLRFGAGLGPGSFSGIRAALAFLQGMALPSGARVEGVSSAAALALEAFLGETDLQRTAVVGDARRNRLWVGIFRREGRSLREIAPLRLVACEHLADALPGDMPVLSPDWSRIGPLLERLLPAERRLPEPCVPSADAVAQLLLDPVAPRIQPPLPVYLHPAVASSREECGMERREAAAPGVIAAGG